jgi:hypothetical protein
MGVHDVRPACRRRGDERLRFHTPVSHTHVVIPGYRLYTDPMPTLANFTPAMEAALDAALARDARREAALAAHTGTTVCRVHPAVVALARQFKATAR